MARKTVEVGTLLYRLNYFLASDRSTAEEREVMCTFVEGILHDTGNYMGFRYLAVEGTTYVQDGSRRYYYPSNAVREDYEAAEALVAKHYYGRGV
jgi:hypothetical protein